MCWARSRAATRARLRLTKCASTTRSTRTPCGRRDPRRSNPHLHPTTPHLYTLTATILHPCSSPTPPSPPGATVDTLVQRRTHRRPASPVVIHQARGATATQAASGTERAANLAQARARTRAATERQRGLALVSRQRVSRLQQAHLPGGSGEGGAAHDALVQGRRPDGVLVHRRPALRPDRRRTYPPRARRPLTPPCRCYADAMPLSCAVAMPLPY